MSNRLRRVIAIIALALILVFTVSLIMYLFDKTLLNGAVGSLALWSGGFGLLFAAVLWISHAFPYQQIKDAEREKLYKEAEEQDETEQDESDTEQSENKAEQNEGESKQDQSEAEQDDNGNQSESETSENSDQVRSSSGDEAEQSENGK